MRHPIYVVGQRHGVPQVILKVFIIMLYENVFQNPELFTTQVSLYPEHPTLVVDRFVYRHKHFSPQKVGLDLACRDSTTTNSV
jgi:hypothetical protein